MRPSAALDGWRCQRRWLGAGFFTGVGGLLLAAAGRDSPRRATSFLAARQERRQRNVPCSQRPRKLRVANLSGQPAVAANTCVRHNSLRAEALHSNRCRKSEHEVWLSFGSQTAGIGCDRRRWLKGVERDILNSRTADSKQPTTSSLGEWGGWMRAALDGSFAVQVCYSSKIGGCCARARRKGPNKLNRVTERLPPETAACVGPAIR